MDRTFHRRISPEKVITAELARHICELSHEINRQIAVLIDRRGHIRWVIVGTTDHINIPPLGRFSPAGSRFNGLRMLHTHLRGEPLSDDDLTDLTLLRFDLVGAITIDNDGLPSTIHLAHLLPPNPQNERFRMIDARHINTLDFNFNLEINAVEQEFSRLVDTLATPSSERVLLVGVATQEGGSTDATMAELEELAHSAGLAVMNSYIQKRHRLDPRYLIGKGKIQQLVLDSMQFGAEMIIFDCPLTPAQARAISAMTDVEVLDRNHLILAIFGQRAQSRAGRLQVELASLKYELPRIHKRAEGLSRIRGGIGALGPGETKEEIHKRRIRQRIKELEREIDRLSGQRQLRRARRNKTGLPIGAIIGYTNSGKSTLLNRLTASKIHTEQKMFATLDPTSRKLHLDDGSFVILIDTVGFIRDLPEDLVSAFRATLEELFEADFLIHLVDASAPDHDTQIDSVNSILKQLGLDKTRQLLVFNKADRLEQDGVELIDEPGGPLIISATTGKNLNRLRLAIQQAITESNQSELRSIG